MPNLGDSFGWPFKDPSWLGKVVLQGLILIIPIIGQIALLGWLLICLDNIRAGRQELAPAGFHLGKGIGLFGVVLIYAIVLAIPAIIIGIFGGIALAANSNGVGGLLLALSSLLRAVGGLALLFLLPAILVATSRGGFSAGMDFGSVWQASVSNPTNTFLAALVLLAAYVIGSLGLILCLVGVLFTQVYAAAIAAGVAAWYEQSQYGGSSPQPYATN
jgi:hypothetical protein